MSNLRKALPLVAAAAFASCAFAVGAEQKKAEPISRDEPARVREARAAPPAPDARQYCADIAAAASAARNARQEKELLDVEQRIAKRTAELEAKRAELQDVLDRYDTLLKQTDERLVSIYGRMRPEAAAAQFANMEEDMAAAMLMRLQPKQSSAILNEMDASRAVMLTKKVAALSSLVGGGKKQ
jgi:flagellar motility protein MotE (MotC chaperone)